MNGRRASSRRIWCYPGSVVPSGNFGIQKSYFIFRRTTTDLAVFMAALSPTDEIVIVGGGIAGLAVALALHRHGFQCQVLEQAHGLSEVGAGLLLSPNACRVLACLGVLDDLRERSSVTPRWVVLDSSGKTLQTLHPSSRASDLSISTRRTDLQSVLLERLPSGWIRPGWKVTSYEDGFGSASAISAGGESAQGKLVIASDGAKSAARLGSGSKHSMTPQGYVGWRALGETVPENWVDGRVTESWGDGMRFGIAAVSDNRCYWYASANAQPGQHPTTEQTHDELVRRFRDWHAPIPELIQRTPPDQILRHDISDAIPTLRPPSFRRTVMIGDAAHPLTPNLGQGAALALEDAWELAVAIAAESSLGKALLRFHRRRRWRIGLIWLASRALGEAIQCEHPFGNWARDHLALWTPDQVASLGLRSLLAFQPTPSKFLP